MHYAVTEDVTTMKYLLMNMRDIDINRQDKVSKLHFSPVLYDDVD